MLHAGRRGIFVMVVVPAFANGEQCHQPVVAAVFAGLVIAVPEHVTERVYRPSDVPYGDDAQVHTPDHHAQSELHRASLPPTDPTDYVTRRKEDRQLRKTDVKIRQRTFFHVHVERVSQKILRKLFDCTDGVCFSVIDHQPTEVGPKKIDQGRMGVGLVIGVNVVNTMNRNPASRGILKAADTENSKRMFHPPRGFETAVRQQSMVADRDALTEHMDTDQHGDEADPRKEIGDQRHQPEQVNDQNSP